MRIADGAIWEGELEVSRLSGSTTTANLEIEIGESFPFQPPKVVDGLMVSARTWHHNRDWSLCLYGTRDVGDRPWQTVSQLMERIRDWFRNAAEGWPSDPPDLDLERYFDRVGNFVTYDNIESFIGKPVIATKASENVLHIDRPGYLARNRRSRRGRWWGWAGDIGELEAPVFDWSTVQDRLGQNSDEVGKRVRNGDYEFLALRYRRQAHTGVIVLFPQMDGNAVTLRAGTAAADDDATRQLRAGDPATVKLLNSKKVAIVGVGAVGSFLAEILARSNIGALHLVDSDLLRPGNSVRHLAGYGAVGRPKTHAVRDLLYQRELMPPDAVRTSESMLSATLASKLLEWADVVIDATADDNVCGLLAHLHDAAADVGMQSAVVSVAVHRSGGIIRTDRWPRSAALPPAPIPAHPDGEIEFREGGCGDPVSATPATSVIEAACLASRHAVDVLTGACAMPDSMVAVLAVQPDPPYQSLGVVAS